MTSPSRSTSCMAAGLSHARTSGGAFGCETDVEPPPTQHVTAGEILPLPGPLSLAEVHGFFDSSSSQPSFKPMVRRLNEVISAINALGSARAGKPLASSSSPGALSSLPSAGLQRSVVKRLAWELALLGRPLGQKFDRQPSVSCSSQRTCRI